MTYALLLLQTGALLALLACEPVLTLILVTSVLAAHYYTENVDD
jgi:hypothetical protein